jgi:hypothetical protein
MESYIDSNLSLKRDWERSQKLHRDKLKSIYTNPSQFMKPTILEPRTLHSKRGAGDRELTIRAENQKLFTKLHRIAEGQDQKLLRAAHKTPRAKQALPTPAQRAKSREIKQENRRLAQRLIFSCASVDSRQFEADYEKTRRLKEMLAKPHLTQKAQRKRSEGFENEIFYEV